IMAGNHFGVGEMLKGIKIFVGIIADSADEAIAVTVAGACPYFGSATHIAGHGGIHALEFIEAVDIKSRFLHQCRELGVIKIALQGDNAAGDETHDCQHNRHLEKGEAATIVLFHKLILKLISTVTQYSFAARHANCYYGL